METAESSNHRLESVQRQQDHIRDTRNYIIAIKSAQKNLLLDPTLSPREWLVKSKEDKADNNLQRYGWTDGN